MQKSLGNDQYPRTITEVLSNNDFDNKNAKTTKTKSPTKQTTRQWKSKNDELPKLSFTQLEGKCYCCGRQGTNPQTVDKRRILLNGQPVKPSHMKNDDQSIAGTMTNNRSTQSVDKKDTHIGWAGILVPLPKELHLKT